MIVQGDWILVRHIKRKQREGSLWVPNSSMRVRAEMGEARVPGLLPMGQVLGVGPKVRGVREGMYVIVGDWVGVSGPEDGTAFYKKDQLLGVVEDDQHEEERSHG